MDRVDRMDNSVLTLDRMNIPLITPVRIILSCVSFGNSIEPKGINGFLQSSEACVGPVSLPVEARLVLSAGFNYN
jgi:hypothetical protein